MESVLIATDSLTATAADAAPMTPPAEAGAGVARVWVDTHAHLHERFDDETYFDATAEHFHRVGAGIGGGIGGGGSGGVGGGGGVLCLTEISDTHAFARLADAERIGRWSFSTRGDHALEATRDDGRRLGLIAGRQVRCDNGLEVLAIGRRVDVADGLAFGESVEAVRASGALTVVPYGVGKWSGSRGGIVRELIERGPADVALGDNGGRLGFGDQALLKRARQLGRTVLVGSDPLRLAAGQTRAGSWGIVVNVTGGHTMDQTWSSRVVDGLRSAGPTPDTFGQRVTTIAAFHQQISLRLK